MASSQEMEAKKSNILSFEYYAANLASTQTDLVLAAAGEATASDVPQQPCPWAGSIVGISVQIEAARSGGSAIFQPTIDGTRAAATATIDADPTQYVVESWNRQSYPVAAGERIGCMVTTDGSWAASTTPSARVVVYVHVETV